jgi:hypothetical protein
MTIREKTTEELRMSERQRLRRQKPSRIEPMRDWSNLYRAADSWEKPEASPEADSTAENVRNGADDSAVEHGVHAGYRVVDEHIRQIREGQWIAGEINHGPYDTRGIGDDVLDIFERLYRYSRDLMPLWSDLAGFLARGPRLLRDLALNGGEDFETRSNGDGGATSIAVEVSSRRRTRVCIDLRTDATILALAVRGLYAIDPAKPPLTEACFVRANGDEGVTLQLHVNDDQPAGVYSGVIVELESGMPRGTLSVTIHE